MNYSVYVFVFAVVLGVVNCNPTREDTEKYYKHFHLQNHTDGTPIDVEFSTPLMVFLKLTDNGAPIGSPEYIFNPVNVNTGYSKVGLVFSFETMHMNCDNSRVTIVTGERDFCGDWKMKDRLRHEKAAIAVPDVTGDGHTIKVVNEGNNNQFKMIVTMTASTAGDGCPADNGITYFKCDIGHCIDDRLTCDTHVNCARKVNNNDKRALDEHTDCGIQMEWWKILLICLGIFAFGGIIITVVCCFLSLVKKILCCCC